MSKDNSPSEVFTSKRDKRAAALVWGIAFLLWLFSFSIIASAGPFIERLIGAGTAFLLGLIGPWLWFTTKYRITETSLHLQSGAFHKELKFHEIRRVTDDVPVRGWSFAFSRDTLHIEAEGSPRGYQISPLDRKGFMEALAKRCVHLKSSGDELIPKD